MDMSLMPPYVKAEPSPFLSVFLPETLAESLNWMLLLFPQPILHSLELAPHSGSVAVISPKPSVSLNQVQLIAT